MKSEERAIVYSRPNAAIKGLELDKFAQKLQALIARKCQAVYVFGSYATGEADGTSDIDLIIVANTDLPFEKRFLEFSEVYELTGEVDLLIYTPKEFTELTGAPGPGFWSHVCKTMRKLF